MPSGLRDALVAAAPWIRRVAGVIFVVFGAGKFVEHASEVAAFERYGLPAPMAFTYAIGVVELGGGLALLAGVATRPVAVVMAANMVGAIVVSGIGEGEVVPSLTLAPLLLLGMLVLLSPGSPGGRRSPSR